MKPEERPTRAQVEQYRMLLPMVQAAHKEAGDLSKKKPDGVLNELKVRHINKLLKEVRTMLGADPSIDFLELLDSDMLPLNSDAAFVLGQYLGALKQFESKHYGYESGGRRWRTQEHPGESDGDQDEESDEDYDDVDEDDDAAEEPES